MQQGDCLTQSDSLVMLVQMNNVVLHIYHGYLNRDVVDYMFTSSTLRLGKENGLPSAILTHCYFKLTTSQTKASDMLAYNFPGLTKCTDKHHRMVQSGKLYFDFEKKYTRKQITYFQMQFIPQLDVDTHFSLSFFQVCVFLMSA